MEQYIIGIDGGGTKTDCALFHTDGRLVEHLCWGTTSHEFLEGSYAAVEREIGAMLRTLFERNGMGPEQVKRGVFGMAGVDTAYQQEKIASIVEKCGIKNALVCNDGYLGIKAGTSNGVGMDVINGTGCSFEGINAMGEMLQIGGQGVIMDDVAGGYVIGRNIVRLVHSALFLGGPKTLLCDMLMAETGTHDRMGLIDELVRRVGENTLEIKHLAHYMFEAAGQNDAVALGFLKQMGRDTAAYCKAVIRSLRLYEETAIEIILIGSAFLRAADTTHISVMKEEILREYDNAIFKPLTIKPVCGAVLWAFEDAGRISAQLREKIIGQLAIA